MNHVDISKRINPIYTGSYLVHGVFGEQDLSLFGGDRGMDDDIFTLPPVHWGGDAVLVADLERYECVSTLE